MVNGNVRGPLDCESASYRFAYPWLGLCLAAFLLANCAPGPREQGVPSYSPRPNPIDWDHPLTEGVPVPSIEAAIPLLDFVPVSPRGLGPPTEIDVNNPARFNQEDRALGMVYDHFEYGPFWILESIAEMDQAQLEKFPEHNGEPGNTVTFTLVTVRQGITALLHEGPNTTAVEWLVSSELQTIDIRVMGPSESFSRSEALAIAEKLV